MNTVFKHVFDISGYGDRILIAIHENDDGMYNYTVSDADGYEGLDETLVPFLESEYKFTTVEKAFEEAKYAYADYDYARRLNAYNKECEKYEKLLKNKKITQTDYDGYIMLLSDKYDM